MVDNPFDKTRLQKILAETAQIAAAFVAKGKRIYLVGGAVRDLALPNAPSSPDVPFANIDANIDFDFTTDALPPEILAIVEPLADSIWEQGSAFGTIGCSIAGRNYEITTHRKEAYLQDSRKPHVVFSQDLNEDLSRRDFTVNAMAIAVPGGTLADPFDGMGALQRRELTTPLSAEVSFHDDPLRMLRAARFASKFDLTPDADIKAAAQSTAGRLAIVSRERVKEELRRILLLADPWRALDFLWEAGLQTQVFGGEFAAAVPSAQVFKPLAELDALLLSRLAGLLAVFALSPIAQPPISELRVSGPLVSQPLGFLSPRDSQPSRDFQNHSDSQSRISHILKSLKFSRHEISATLDVIEAIELFVVAVLSGFATRLSDFATQASGLVAAQVAARRLFVQLGQSPHELAAAIQIAQKLGLVTEAESASFAELCQQVASQPLELPLTGKEIIDHLQLSPGPLIGQAKDHLWEVLIQKGQLTRQQALAELDRWACS